MEIKENIEKIFKDFMRAREIEKIGVVRLLTKEEREERDRLTEKHGLELFQLCDLAYKSGAFDALQNRGNFVTEDDE